MATTTKQARPASRQMRAIKVARLTKEYDGTIKAYYRISDLKLDPENARQHFERDITAQAESIEQFTQQKPVVIDADGVVRAGNGTCLALMQKGEKEVWGVRTHLRGAQAQAYALADNRTAELSAWNYEQVSAILKSMKAEGQDITKLGWTDYELAPLLQAEWHPPEKDGSTGEGEEGFADLPDSNVRQVNLFFTDKTLPVFLERVNALTALWESENLTAAVERAVEYAHDQLCGESRSKKR
jgi:hypothetical protein